MFLSIDDPKKRDQIVDDFLKTRRNIKQNFEQEKQFKIGYREETEKLFKPITESIGEQNIVHKKELSTLGEKLTHNQGKIYQKLNQIPALTGPKPLLVSKLIQSYLSDTDDRSKAGYSIRFDTNTNQYTIGNSVIKFDNNTIEIAGKKYEATAGLMELLTKKDPNEDICIEEDYEDYKEILEKTSAIYQGFNRESNKVNSDKSEKWKLIKTLLPHLFKKSGGKLNTTFLPSDPKSLVDQLHLSLASYHAGNDGEYNKINVILDELVKQKIITKNDYIKIHRNVFSS
jgi:hypothetical protein